MKNLSELPDIDGFRFTGISDMGVKFPCVICMHPRLGKRIVLDNHKFACVSHLLKGWEDL